MKTRTLKTAVFTTLTLLISYSVWSTNLTYNENGEKHSTNVKSDVPGYVGETSTAIIKEFKVGNSVGTDIGEDFFNIPDPFFLETTIYYTLTKNSLVTLTVYSTKQNPVVLVRNERQSRGKHAVIFNSQGMPSGIYKAVLQTDNDVQVEIMTKKGGISNYNGTFNKE